MWFGNLIFISIDFGECFIRYMYLNTLKLVKKLGCTFFFQPTFQFLASFEERFVWGCQEILVMQLENNSVKKIKHFDFPLAC